MSLCFFRASCLPSFLTSFFEGFLRSVCSFLRPPGTCPSVRLSLCSVWPSVCLYVCQHVCLSISAVCVCLSVSQFFPASFFLCASGCSPEDSIFGSGNQVSEFAYTPLRTHWHDLKWHLQDQTPIDSRQQSLLLSLTSHTYLQRGKHNLVRIVRKDDARRGNSTRICSKDAEAFFSYYWY